jgi:hypothetical protein
VLDHRAHRVSGDMTNVVDTAPPRRAGHSAGTPGSAIFGPVPTGLPCAGDEDAVLIAGDTRG